MFKRIASSVDIVERDIFERVIFERDILERDILKGTSLKGTSLKGTCVGGLINHNMNDHVRLHYFCREHLVYNMHAALANQASELLGQSIV
jgi:hypothetical protein